MAALTAHLSGALQSLASLGADTALKGLALLCIVTLLTLLLRRHVSASSRHMLWTMSLAALLALPLMARGLPRWSLPLARPAGLETLLATSDGGRFQEAAGSTTTSRPVTPPPQDLLRSAPREAQAAGREARPTNLDARAAALATRAAVPEPPQTPSPMLQVQLPMALMIWLAGTLLLAGWFALVHGSARWVGLQARTWPEDETHALVRCLGQQIGLRRSIRLLEGDTQTMPMTWGLLRPVLLLPRDARSWPQERLRHVILHELSHVRRGDPWTRLLAQAACTLHWFNPLTWYASRRLTLESEHACDDCVLQAGVRPSDYAEDLLEVARCLRRQSLRGAIAMAGSSSLRQRLVAVLDARCHRGRLGGWAMSLGLLVISIVVFPLASLSWTPADDGAVETEEAAAVAEPGEATDTVEPGETSFAETGSADPQPQQQPPEAPEPVPAPPAPPTPPAPPAPPAPLFSDSETNRIHGSWEMRTDKGLRLRVKARGEIEFNSEGTDIVSISDYGSFDLRYQEGKVRYRIRIDGDTDGTTSRRYWVGRKERPYDAEAQQRLAEVLPILFREMGWMTGAWVQRTLDKEGVDGVLKEVEKIESDFVTRKALVELERRADLDAAQRTQVYKLAGRKIDSDFELASLLVNSAESRPLDRSTLVAYCRTAGNIDSDFEKARALSGLLQVQKLDDVGLGELLHTASGIDSSFELARVMMVVLDTQALREAALSEWISTLQEIDSDFELSRVAQHAAVQRSLSDADMSDLVRAAAAKIDSDFELARFLVMVAIHYEVQGDLREAYLDAADSIDSTHESQRALAALVRRGESR